MYMRILFLVIFHSIYDLLGSKYEHGDLNCDSLHCEIATSLFS